jgi:O-antigen/teichoic acid export membrane protein
VLTGFARRGVGRDALASLFLHGASLLLSFALGIFLARALGPASYGALAVVLALLGVLANASALGLPNTVTRRVAAHYAQGSWGDITGIITFATRTTGAAALVITLGALIVLLIVNPFAAISTTALVIGVCSIPAVALTQVDGATLRGFGRGIISQLVTNLLRPMVLLAIVCTWFIVRGYRLDYNEVVVANLIAAMSVWMAARVWCRRTIRTSGTQGAEGAGVAPLNVWPEALPFLLVSVLALVGARIDLFLITFLLDMHSAGLYEVAARGADLVLMPLTATGVVLAPEFSRRNALRDHAALQRLATLSCWGLFIASLPIALALVLGSRQITSFAFGPDYAASSGSLAILALGYLATLSLGPVHLILGMTGYSRQSAAGAIAAVIMGSGLSAVLIPMIGIEGAAVARGVSQTAVAIWLAILVRRALGVRSALLPLPWASKGSAVPCNRAL